MQAEGGPGTLRVGGPDPYAHSKNLKHLFTPPLVAGCTQAEGEDGRGALQAGGPDPGEGSA